MKPWGRTVRCAPFLFIVQASVPVPVSVPDGSGIGSDSDRHSGRGSDGDSDRNRVRNRNRGPLWGRRPRRPGYERLDSPQPGASLGVPSLAFFSVARSGDHPRSEKRHRGHPRGTWPRERSTTVAIDGKASMAYGRPLVRSGRGVRRTLSWRDESISPGAEGGRRRPIGVVAALPIHHPSDRADGATLGRRRRIRRPGMRDTSATATATGSATAIRFGGRGSGSDLWRS